MNIMPFSIKDYDVRKIDGGIVAKGVLPALYSKPPHPKIIPLSLPSILLANVVSFNQENENLTRCALPQDAQISTPPPPSKSLDPPLSI